MYLLYPGPFPGAGSLNPLSRLSHTHDDPRLSMSYQWLTAIVTSDWRTKCHQPAGRYSVSPARTVILIGCASAGRAVESVGSRIEDQRTSDVVDGEGTSSSCSVVGERT